MVRKTAVAVVAIALMLSLSGCIRFSSNYYIRDNWTVDGSITTSIKKDYATEDDPYKGTGAGDIADFFGTIEEINDLSDGEWYTYEVLFLQEPLDSFMAEPTEPWQIRVGFDGEGQQIWGYDTDNYDEDTRDTIISEGGYVNLTVLFPREITDPGNLQDRTPEGSGEFAYWNLLAMNGKPYAASFHDGPLPETEPDPPAPDPDPVAEPTPSASPSVAASDAPSAAPTKAPVAKSEGGSIPAWVWVVLGTLGVAVAGLVGFMIASRSKAPGVGAEADPDGGADGDADK